MNKGTIRYPQIKDKLIRRCRNCRHWHFPENGVGDCVYTQLGHRTVESETCNGWWPKDYNLTPQPE